MNFECFLQKCLYYNLWKSHKKILIIEVIWRKQTASKNIDKKYK